MSSTPAPIPPLVSGRTAPFPEGQPGVDHTAEPLISCPVCYAALDAFSRRPFDLGCGHSICEACLLAHPAAFRRCPECRTPCRAAPHVNVSLLRVVSVLQPGSPSTDASPAAPSANGGPDSSASAPDSFTINRRGATSITAPGAASPPTLLQPWNNPDLPAFAVEPLLQRFGSLRARVRGGGGGQAAAGGANAHGRVVNGGGGGGGFDMAMFGPWLLPLLLLGYIISPIDVIPDFIPILGMLDDIVAFFFLLVSVCHSSWGALQAQANRRPQG